MADWQRPPEGSESLKLEELVREGAGASDRFWRWCLGAFAVGVIAVCVVGFSTDLFDSGPTEVEVNNAFREGVEAGAEARAAFWEEELERLWWAAYEEGKGEGRSIAPVLLTAAREGFSYESGLVAGLASEEVDLEVSYAEGWRDGYALGFTAAAGAAAAEVPSAPSPSVEQRLAWEAQLAAAAQAEGEP